MAINQYLIRINAACEITNVSLTYFWSPHHALLLVINQSIDPRHRSPIAPIPYCAETRTPARSVPGIDPLLRRDKDSGTENLLRWESDPGTEPLLRPRDLRNLWKIHKLLTITSSYMYIIYIYIYLYNYIYISTYKKYHMCVYICIYVYIILYMVWCFTLPEKTDECFQMRILSNWYRVCQKLMHEFIYSFPHSSIGMANVLRRSNSSSYSGS